MTVRVQFKKTAGGTHVQGHPTETVLRNGKTIASSCVYFPGDVFDSPPDNPSHDLSVLHPDKFTLITDGTPKTTGKGNHGH